MTLSDPYEVIAALDPRLRVLVDLGDALLTETGGIISLGVSQKGRATKGASGAFGPEL